MGRWLGRFLKTVRAASGASPALAMASVVVVVTGNPSPCSTLMWGALDRRSTARARAAMADRVWAATTPGKALIYRWKGTTWGAWTLGRLYLEFELEIDKVR
jgi:hypothetical protein